MKSQIKVYNNLQTLCVKGSKLKAKACFNWFSAILVSKVNDNAQKHVFLKTVTNSRVIILCSLFKIFLLWDKTKMFEKGKSIFFIVSSSNPESRNFKEKRDPINYHKCMYNHNNNVQLPHKYWRVFFIVKSQ